MSIFVAINKCIILKILEIMNELKSINVDGVSFFVSKSKFANCTCQCRRHTIEAKRQARAIYERFVFPGQYDKHGQSHNQAVEHPLNLEKVLGKKQTCVHHMCIFLLTTSHFLGEEIAASVLQQRYPLASRSMSKKSNLQHAFS